MTGQVDFSQFSEGDDVAVTIVGKIDANGDLELPDNYFLVGSLAYAVDACRIKLAPDAPLGFVRL